VGGSGDHQPKRTEPDSAQRRTIIRIEAERIRERRG
jgi:hypothetical protein